jgi:drug/metabolite transporter (DMT)-like permease
MHRVNEEQQPGLRSWLLLGLLALIWGSSFILIKKGLMGLNIGEVGALRIVSAGLFLTPIALYHLRKVSRAYYGKLFLTGLLGNVIPAFLFAIAQSRLDSGITGILNSITPLFALIIGVVFFGRSFTRRDLIGLVIAFTGCVVLIWSGSQGRLSNVNYYIIFVILATACYGTNVNYIKHYLKDLKALEITAVSLMFNTPLALIYLLFFTDFINQVQVERSVMESAGAIALLGIMGTAIALIFFNEIVKQTTPVFATTVTYLIPIVAVFWAVVDGEILYMGHYLGMVTIIGGVYLANLKKKKQFRRKQSVT